MAKFLYEYIECFMIKMFNLQFYQLPKVCFSSVQILLPKKKTKILILVQK